MATQPARKPRPLTLKQQAFVRELPLSKSATEAAIKAGYSATGNTATVKASQLVRNGNVLPAIKAAQEAATSAAIATLIERKEALSRVLREPETGPYPIQAVIAASDQLNRMERVYDDRTPVVHDNRTQILMAYSPEQLRALLEAMKAEDETPLEAGDQGT